MTKRRISLALIVAMLLTLMMPTLAFGADYSGHWAEETIQEWFDNNKLKGYEDGSFRPDAHIIRVEFMTMVNNAYGYTEKADVSFTDVDPDDWFYPEVQKAVKAGYLLGYEDNTARPGIKITRQEAALIIARIKGLSDNASVANIFNDASEIAIWAKGGVGAVVKAKYMIGYEDSTFRPQRFISRAEALVTNDRAYEEVAPTIPPTTGGGSGGTGGGSESVTTRAAILSSLTITDSTTESAITIATPAAIGVTTLSGITTTSSAITITAIGADGATVAFTVTTPSGIATTVTAIDGVAYISLDAPGAYTIGITVSKTNSGRIEYIDTKYSFIVTKVLE